MKRTIAVLSVTVAGLAAWMPAPNAQTNEVKLCDTDRGWEIAAGNLPPRLPNTKCGFAIATYRAAKERRGDLTELPSRFRLAPRGDGIGCKAKASAAYAEFRCEDRKSFVLAYSFR